MTRHILDGTTVVVVDGEPVDKIFVIATTYKKYEEWCKKNGLNQRSKLVKYVRSEQDFLNEKDIWVKDLGTTFERGAMIYDCVYWNAHTGNFKEIP